MRALPVCPEMFFEIPLVAKKLQPQPHEWRPKPTSPAIVLDDMMMMC
jgi:hypothetical protein